MALLLLLVFHIWSKITLTTSKMKTAASVYRRKKKIITNGNISIYVALHLFIVLAESAQRAVPAG